jgi:hypothetical protein
MLTLANLRYLSRLVQNDYWEATEIRKPTKNRAQLLEEIADKLAARDKEDSMIREQLRLVMQEPDGRVKKGRR